MESALHNDHALENILHDLIRMHKESAEAYSKAAHQLRRNEELRLLCEEFAEDSDLFADELRTILISEYPYITHQPKPMVYHPRTTPYTTFSTQDVHSVLHTCVSGEETMLHAYQEALSFCRNKHADMHTALADQAEALYEACEELKSFRQVAALKHAV